MTKASKKIRKIGSSVGVILNRAILEEIYGLSVGDDIEIKYESPNIIIRKAVKKEE